MVRINETQNKRQALFFSIGIVVLLVVLIQFGPILVNVFGNIVYSLRGGDKSDNAQLVGKELLQPPILFGVPEATQSANISFSGQAADKNGTVELYVNDELEDEIEINNTTQFSVKKLYLKKGTNTLKARFLKGDKTSSFTEEYVVNFIANKPKLELSNPQDGQQFTKADKSITVTGTTDSDNSVTINSFRAIVDSDGNFSYLLQLNDGDNTLKITAQNPAGSTTEKEIKVKYNP